MTQWSFGEGGGRRVEDDDTRASASVPILHSAAQRSAELARRASFQERLASSVDEAVAKADGGDGGEASTSCFGGLYRLLTPCTRGRRHRRLLDIDVPASATRTARAASAALSTTGASLSLFGRRRAVGGGMDTAATRLAEVGETLDARIATVEARAVSAKAEAAKLFAAGGKASALRAMRRSKALEKQATALSGTAVAIERQSAMLEDAGLQQQVANAMQAGVKGMKKTAKALKDVESVVDDASEIRDRSEDINAALAELGTAYEDPGIDDDDLLGELEEMVEKVEKVEKAVVVVPTKVPSMAFPVVPRGGVLSLEGATAATAVAGNS